MHSIKLRLRVLRTTISTRTSSLPLAALTCLAMPGMGLAQNDACIPDPADNSKVICTGDQREGINLTSETVTQLQIGDLDAPGLWPAPGVAGIDFASTSGSDVMVTVGNSEDRPAIHANGAAGIRLDSSGRAPAPTPNPVLGIPVPGDGSGGLVRVLNHAAITVTGDGAHGIHATSSTTGFHSSVTADLDDFINNNGEANIVFRVISVAGDNGEVGNQIAGVMIGADGLPVTDNTGIEIDGGLFTIFEDGTFDFDFGSAFDDLEIDETVNTRIAFTVEMTSSTSTSGETLESDGSLNVTVRRAHVTDADGSPMFDDDGNPLTELVIDQGSEIDPDTGDTIVGPERIEARFTDFGGSNKPTEEGTVFPDLTLYAERLRADAQSGGAGNSVSIESDGSIDTSGNKAYGVLAESKGAPGGNGRDAYLCHRKPRRGGDGKRGGNVSVTADGTIATSGAESAALVAISLAGDGGDGGEGNACRYGKGGGTGGNGGDVDIRGSATIETDGEFASGILAVSQGGYGGNAGSGSWSTGGGAGGHGGKGGRIDVQGAWDITTLGDKAHGIWAKSVGGNAGAGGSAGWLGTADHGAGGRATDGGNVSVTSGGNITTYGNDSYGIYAESIGGFGGKGGGGFGLFHSAGGDGNSAGSGGNVAVTTTETSSVWTEGVSAHGVFAQSVGGGGGSGGGAGGISASGGSGAPGGNGGTVDVINAGKVDTVGLNSHGIYAQSIGGGGGDGGSAGGLVGIGGRGSSTSAGGTVDVVNTGAVTTRNDLSRAIYAQSIGGGGGDGGSSSGLVSIGGRGGGGGGSDTVRVLNRGTLETMGHDSAGIFAQSVGGGGGNGGGSVAVGVFVSVGIGGGGGTGGDGANVVADHLQGSIITGGDRSHGLHAQSIGGGGGNGGYAVSASVGYGVGLSVAIGGPGGNGGKGDEVHVTSGGDITTQGKDAHGIFAQSVGGGGGSGGFSVAASVSAGGVTGAVALAGNGGVGSNGGKVTVSTSGIITTGIADRMQIAVTELNTIDEYHRQLLVNAGYTTIAEVAEASESELLAFVDDLDRDKATEILFLARLHMQRGDHSYGILAQSVGGGGGDGGFSVAGALDMGAGGAAFSMGGAGGKGGGGGDVTLNGSSNITTYGTDSHAIVSQSIGGGGGSGGFSVAGALSSGAGAAASLGGSGGEGSIGGNVRVGLTETERGIFELQALTGDISTYGGHAYGILAQSVGGGGGDGGFSVGGAITSGPSAAFSMGGSGGNGGNGGDVSLFSSTNITTYGNDSHAIVSQSVGGGGGSGGFSVAGTLSSAGGAAASLGGSGGEGSIGGNVFVGVLPGSDETVEPLALTGGISTYGNHAYGILAQSVGGGGGDGGFSVGGAISKGPAGAFSMGGSGGGGGVAGLVKVNSAADISTLGRDAHGMVAQSVGGGGGSGGFSVAGGLSAKSGIGASLGGSGGPGGDGDTVTVANHGNIQTGAGGQRQAELAELEGIDSDALTMLEAEGFETIAELADTPQSELSEIEGIDEDLASTLLEQANLFMDKDSHAYGILAQSVGGGGGDGGFSVAGSFSKEGPGAAFSMGGSGASGGDAGSVDVTNNGTITTRAEDSYGILAQSTGGGGGSGGFSVAGQMSLGESKGGLGISIGGFGGEGGAGENVSVTNNGAIATEGGDAHGIYALSIGGGGGAGGFSASGTISGKKSKQLGVSVGGFGGDGGAGGKVHVSNLGSVTTLSRGANAIYAQSVGGGGGDGGTSFTGTFAGPETKQLSASVGGFGGDGNEGGLVRVSNSGSLETSGEFAAGINAQSVGGGGGAGGLSMSTGFAISGPKKSSTINASISLGGFGGKGGRGGDVVVLNCEVDDAGECLADSAEMAIVTKGDDAHGVYAQSVGGGGGDGGSSIGATLGLDPKGEGKSFGLTAALGGIGGDGNTGGSVTVGNRGLIDTLGNEAHGIFAQSVGGGGGSGGSARTLAIVLGKKAKAQEPEGGTTEKKKKKRPKDSNKALQVAVGGEGGNGAVGGDVTVRNAGTIITRGADSHGIFAQSIGGGGGNGGNGAHGIPEIPPISDHIDAALDKAKSKVEKKNKLTFTKNLEVVVGGNGGIGNDGGRVNVDYSGEIITLYDGSFGVLAQSIGAGGGIGGNAALGLKGKFGLGGGGGASGDGGEVIISLTGAIETVGATAHGIFAQSIGGGGGVAGDVDMGIIDSKTLPIIGETPSLNIGLGFAATRDGGSAGIGGNIDIDFDGMLTTHGHAAIGILAQSIGGGGGLAGDSGFGLLSEIGDVLACSYVEGASGVGNAVTQQCNAWVGSAGGDGSGGVIDITHQGRIETFGDVAHGIFAQSAGGVADDIVPLVIKLDENGEVVTEQLVEDGEPVFDEDNNPVMIPVWEEASGEDLRGDLVDLGGNINITVDGDVLVHGEFAHGIFAHTSGGDGNGNITIDILAGTLQGGASTGAGIRFKGGGENTLTNAGWITSAEGVFGEAIFADTGNETIHNAGIITGSVNLGDGLNAFNNDSGATFNAGSEVYLGSENMLFNAGTLAPGGYGTILTSNLTGNLTQTSTGTLALDIDAQSKAADLVVQDGNADLAGTVDINILNAGWATPGSGQITVFSGTGSVTDSGLSLVAPESAVSTYELTFVDDRTMAIDWNINFAPAALNHNNNTIGEYVNAVQSAGGAAELEPVIAMMFELPDHAGLSRVYEMMNPQISADNDIAALASDLSFSDALLSCKVRAGEYHFVREGQCGWMRIQTGSTSRDSTEELAGYDEDTWQLAGGLQVNLDDDWTIGGALSLEEREMTLANGFANSEGYRYHGGLVVKRRSGPSMFSTSLTAGFTDTDNMRLLPDGSVATGSQRINSLSAQLRAERAFDFTSSYLKPRLDLGVTHLSRDAYRETGPSGVTLDVAGSSDTHVYSQLAVEAGFERMTESGWLFRPNLSVGVTRLLSDEVPGATAAFVVGPEEAGTFTVTSYLERTYLDTGLEIALLSQTDFALTLGTYERRSDYTTSRGGVLKVAFPF